MAKLEHVAATVAIDRMYIYARRLSVTERGTLAHTLLSGHEITYQACDALGQPIGTTHVTPETFPPVAYVTETMTS
jgi:hypothetical protein